MRVKVFNSLSGTCMAQLQQMLDATSWTGAGFWVLGPSTVKGTHLLAVRSLKGAGVKGKEGSIWGTQSSSYFPVNI